MPFGMSRRTFLLAFILGPTLAFGIVPNVIFTLLNGWNSRGVTNIIWGPVFGAGFWLTDLAVWAPGTGSDSWIKIGGLVWAFVLIPIVLFLASNWLWWKLGARGRKIALTLLFASFLCVVPIRALNTLALHGIVLPDWALYIASVY